MWVCGIRAGLARYDLMRARCLVFPFISMMSLLHTILELPFGSAVIKTLLKWTRDSISLCLRGKEISQYVSFYNCILSQKFVWLCHVIILLSQLLFIFHQLNWTKMFQATESMLHERNQLKNHFHLFAIKRSTRQESYYIICDIRRCDINAFCLSIVRNNGEVLK